MRMFPNGLWLLTVDEETSEKKISGRELSDVVLIIEIIAFLFALLVSLQSIFR